MPPQLGPRNVINLYLPLASLNISPPRATASYVVRINKKINPIRAAISRPEVNFSGFIFDVNNINNVEIR